MKKTVFTNKEDFINYCNKCYDENKDIDWTHEYNIVNDGADQEEEWVVIEA